MVRIPTALVASSLLFLVPVFANAQIVNRWNGSGNDTFSSTPPATFSGESTPNNMSPAEAANSVMNSAFSSNSRFIGRPNQGTSSGTDTGGGLSGNGGFVAVPEPGTIMLMTTACVAGGVFLLRRKKVKPEVAPEVGTYTEFA